MKSKKQKTNKYPEITQVKAWAVFTKGKIGEVEAYEGCPQCDSSETVLKICRYKKEAENLSFIFGNDEVISVLITPIIKVNKK